jgi:hypothetical protein
VYPYLTDDEYRPVECIQTAGQTLFVPAGWWMASLSVGDSEQAAVSLRSHYASAAQLDAICSTLPPVVLVRLKNRLWAEGQSNLVRRIDVRMRTPGRAEVARVLRRIGASIAGEEKNSKDGEEGDDGSCDATERAAGLPLALLSDGQDTTLSDTLEAPRHSHVNPVRGPPPHFQEG